MDIKTTEKNQTVIPAMHPSMDGLIRESIGRGWISYEEVNSALPDEFLFPYFSYINSNHYYYNSIEILRAYQNDR